VRLILTLVGGGLSGPDTMRTISSGSLSIGRSAGNDWVLPDPARFLSKEHCVISADNGRFVLTDLSSNGVYINDAPQATSRESRTSLNDGDRLRLGEYVINVAEVDDRPALTSGHGETDGSWLPVRDPFSGGREGGSPLNVDPLDDPFGRAPDPSFQHPIAPMPSSRRGEDPFDLGGKQSARRPDPNDDLFRGISPADNWQGAPRPDHAPAPAQAIPPPRVISPVPPGEIDFDALLGDLILPGSGPQSPPLPAVPASQGPAPPPLVAEHDPFAAADAPELARPQATPRPGAKRTVGEDASPTLRPAVSGPGQIGSSDARAAFAAFLEGAGMAGQPIDDKDPEAALRAAGAVFRAMAEGVREVLLSRAAIKGEMRVAQTMIRARGNNALKFSVNADDAVSSLLSPKRAGYMDPLPAAQEAFADIKAHELAVMAGVQTALLALLRRFDPDALEERLAKTRLGSVLPGARKARYWDAFRQVYDEISREAEDDFQSVFGRSFAQAYSMRTRKD
jgi:type VI secretion system protein